jgi:predicted transposase YbfD/YdcC
VPDPRDNRGKRHRLSFVLAGLALAVMAGRTTMSSIHRFFTNRLEWLREVTGESEAHAPSRAQLPRIAAVVDWAPVNHVVESHFDVRITKGTDGWVAVDGKTLRGTEQQSERTLLAVSHEERRILAQRRMSGPKVAEVTAARELLRETGLETAKVTLDALHLNPQTTAQIHQAQGTYLIQVKENQPELRARVEVWAKDREPLGSVRTEEQAHGRHEIRRGKLLSLQGMELDERWQESGLQTLLVMERETTHLAQRKTSADLSYYVTNQRVDKEQADQHQSLFMAVRNHWGVEADNNIRDVTFREDSIKTKNGNQGQVLASLRTFAMRLFRAAKVTNFRAALEDLCDNPRVFQTFLAQTGFL